MELAIFVMDMDIIRICSAVGEKLLHAPDLSF